MPAMQFRLHGPTAGAPTVIVVHGGPGMPGSCGALARALADPARVLEPWQTAHTVADHIADLAGFVAAQCGAPPIIVGHSWGAILALAFAAAHPAQARAIALVGSGTYDMASRLAFKRALAALLPADAELWPRSRRRALIDRVYTVEGLPAELVDGAPLDTDAMDERANRASWDDMLRLQADATYPAAFAAIRAPVVMLHGAHDPHPGPMIRDSLAPHLPQLEYREFARCGHYPWRERAVRDDFVRELRGWIARFA
jgi:pimeloyl-ACP methyl ester carboxylesterase